MDAKELVTVYTVADPVNAEIVKNALGAEGIRCFLQGMNICRGREQQWKSLYILYACVD